MDADRLGRAGGLAYRLDALGIEKPAAHIDHLAGAMIVTVSIIDLAISRGPKTERCGVWDR